MRANPITNALKKAWLYSTPVVVQDHIRRLNPRSANDLSGTITVDSRGRAAVPPMFGMQ
ncbi:MAG: hypothetical protein [Bacteriophage sp.]|nr:MAG: hypothetical protein [Bacteriophage sp.]